VERLWRHSGNLIRVRCPQLFNQGPPDSWSWDTAVLTVYECNQELEIFSCFLLISGEIEQGSRHNPDQETIVYESFAFIIPQPGNRFRVCSERCRLLLSATPTSSQFRPNTFNSDAGATEPMVDLVEIRAQQLMKPIINMSEDVHQSTSDVMKTPGTETSPSLLARAPSFKVAAAVGSEASPSLRPRAAGFGSAFGQASDAAGAGAKGGDAPSFIL
jgi:hypothetical protein